MNETKQKTESKPSIPFRRLATGGSLIHSAGGHSNLVARPPAFTPSIINSTSYFSVSRRHFLQRGSLAVAAGTLLRSVIAVADTTDRPVPSHKAPPAGMLLNGTAALCRPQLEPSSQLSFRLGLALKRTAAYPLDSLDFILMDLERPDGRSRQAHWCTGDLSGRTLELLAVCEGLDGRSDSRLPELFARS